MSNTKNERKTMIVEQYVADHVSPEDEPHVRIIARMAQHTIFEKFRAMLDENIVLAVFGCTIDAIFDTLKEAQKKGHKECMFRIANRLIVGYTNDGLVDEDYISFYNQFNLSISHIPPYEQVKRTKRRIKQSYP